MADKNYNPKVDEYIQQFSEDIKLQLNMLRETIHKTAPDSMEVISYKIPAYKYFGMLAYFAVRKNHISLYPYPSAIVEFKDQLLKYKTSEGTVKFPLNQPLPLKLIQKLIAFRVEENLNKEIARKQKIGKK